MFPLGCALTGEFPHLRKGYYTGLVKIKTSLFNFSLKAY